MKLYYFDFLFQIWARFVDFILVAIFSRKGNKKRRVYSPPFLLCLLMIR
nr:MAG TPA: hypothetical protein [Caudoviricetes sp.]